MRLPRKSAGGDDVENCVGTQVWGSAEAGAISPWVRLSLRPRCTHLGVGVGGRQVWVPRDVAHRQMGTQVTRYLGWWCQERGEPTGGLACLGVLSLHHILPQLQSRFSWFWKPAC